MKELLKDFSIGDKVRITEIKGSPTEIGEEEYIGLEGVIVNIDENDDEFPIQLEFEDDSLISVCWRPDEIELVE